MGVSKSRRGAGRRRAVAGVVVVVLVVACLALVTGVVVKARAEAAAASRSAHSYSPPPLATPSPAARPVVAVVGDGTVTSAARGVDAAGRWPALLSAAADLDVRAFAASGASYTAKGSDGRTFLQEAARIPADAEVVVIFGGIGDVDADQLDVSRAVSQTISEVQTRAPQAQIAVVGPVTDDSAATADVTALRTTLQNAAGAFGLRYTDPIQQAWLNGSPASPSDLSAANERTLALRFQTVVTQLLPSQS